jgi:hypothetical protein
MDIAKKKEEAILSEIIPVRISKSMREKVRLLAKNQSNEKVKVKESEIYRAAIEKYLLEMATKCSRSKE